MKNLFAITILLCISLFSSCVQKSKKQTVHFILDVSGIKNIKTVGLRGENKPLSWQEDLPLKPIKKDSLYEVSISGETGYKFVEVKFTLNGAFELENKPNRRVIFNETGITEYKTKFNKE